MNENDSEAARMMREGSTELFKYGTVDPSHDTGDARVRFDGEEEAGVVGHAHVEPYVDGSGPSANDRVMMMRHGKSWVILGRVV